MPLIAAEAIWTPDGWLENAMLEYGKDGSIQAIHPFVSENVSVHSGVLIPGFVNVHCHLELSALHQKVKEGTGMTAFARAINEERQKISPEIQQASIQNALAQAWESGTQAFGDICNDSSSAQAKLKYLEFSFRNYVEVFGLNPNRAKEIWERAEQIKNRFCTVSITLHAPYSVSPELLEIARDFYRENLPPISIHLLESKAEREIFEENSGEFLDFYKNIGLDFQGFPKKDALSYIMQAVQKEQKCLLIHGTEMRMEEIDFLAQSYPEAYFGLCPRSNLFIHNSFPNLKDFLKHNSRICIGTDSLASNYSLDMLEELKVIQARDESISTHELIRFASYNGARALDFQDFLGDFSQTKNLEFYSFLI